MTRCLNVVLFMVFGGVVFSMEPLWKGFILIGLLVASQLLVAYMISKEIGDSLKKK